MHLQFQQIIIIYSSTQKCRKGFVLVWNLSRQNYFIKVLQQKPTCKWPPERKVLCHFSVISIKILNRKLVSMSDLLCLEHYLFSCHSLEMFHPENNFIISIQIVFFCIYSISFHNLVKGAYTKSGLWYILQQVGPYEKLQPHLGPTHARFVEFCLLPH